MLKSKKYHFFQKAVVFAVVMICLSGCGQAQDLPMLLDEELMISEKVNYKTVQVQETDYQKEAEGKAAVLYMEHQNIYKEDGAAYFTECLVKIGQEVKQGDVLMRFEPETDQLQLESLRIQLLRTEESFEKENTEKYAQLHAAKVKAQELKDHELVIAEWKIEKQQAAYDLFLYEADKNIRKLKEQIQELEAQAVSDTVTAPFDGVVEEIVKINAGDLVNEGQWLIRLYSTDRVLLQALSAGNKLRYNMDVVVEKGKNNAMKSYSGKVIVSPEILPYSLSQELTLIELSESTEEIESKAHLEIRGVSEAIHNILMVPRNAVQREDREEFVHILSDNMIQKRYIKTAMTTPDGVWVLDGLEEGQTLIVD